MMPTGNHVVANVREQVLIPIRLGSDPSGNEPESKRRLAVDAPWWRESVSESNPIVARLTESVEARTQATGAARESRLADKGARLLDELEQLPPLPSFRDPRTKGAMVAYVEEHHPDARVQLCARAHLERTRR